jgi:hypothetical protein
MTPLQLERQMLPSKQQSKSEPQNSQSAGQLAWVSPWCQLQMPSPQWLHAPFTQTWPDGQAWPQLPQLLVVLSAVSQPLV